MNIQHAYKKLKSSVYFDKTQSLLRTKIIQYEFDDTSIFKNNGLKLDDASIFENNDLKLTDLFIDTKFQRFYRNRNDILQKKLNDLYEKILDDSDWQELKCSILNSIRAVTFPKKIKSQSTINASFISNKEMIIPELEEKYFIDMDVEGHILGVLWILMAGISLDENMYEHSYGNRLNKHIFGKTDKKTTFTPTLFKPYFKQYETWRNYGLKIADDRLLNKQNILILSLDFKNYYHSIHLTDKIKKMMIDEINLISDDEKDKVIINRLNSFVFDVIDRYSSVFQQENETGKKILPIGFLPSNIISNWYLNHFDSAINNIVNPIYYGRYVDDILLVVKIEKNTEIYKAIHAESTLGQMNSSDDSNIVSKIMHLLFLNCIDNGCDSNKNILRKSDDVYIVSLPFYNDTELAIQNSKIKAFYFNYECSSALLKCFREQIIENNSEFRFLPEDEALLYSDYNDIYEINSSDTINKFGSIDKINISKYELSKFLGKQLSISTYVVDNSEKNFIKDISKIFNFETTILNYTVWETVCNYLVINDISSVEIFARIILNFINAIPENSSKNKNIISIKYTLQNYFESTLIRATSIVWNNTIDGIINKIFGDETKVKELNKLRFYCFIARMSNKFLMIGLPDIVMESVYNYYEKKYENGEDIENKTNIELCKFHSFMDNVSLKVDNISYLFYPYFVSYTDISNVLFLQSLHKYKDDHSFIINDNYSLFDKVKSIYAKVNFNNSASSVLTSIHVKMRSSNASVIKIFSKCKDKFKIAIANVSTEEPDFINACIDKPNRSISRYKKIANIINLALKENVDMLIFPENYVPYEWVDLLIKACKNSRMTIIAGIEHVIYKRRAVNLTLTLIPFDNDEYTSVFIGYHNKVHYSPKEKLILNGYGITEIKGTGYEIYSWKDLWFSTYCCYEIASINDRSLFYSILDLFIAVEWNQDVGYFGNIIESLSNDMHCYCVQVNASQFGDSRITQPTKSEIKDVIKIKGGINSTILVGEINILALRKFQLQETSLQLLDKSFKPTPPNFNKDIAKAKFKKDDDYILKYILNKK